MEYLLDCPTNQPVTAAIRSAITASITVRTIHCAGSSNGDDNRTRRVTPTCCLNGQKARLPDFNRNSEQWNWAVRELPMPRPVAIGVIFCAVSPTLPFGYRAGHMPDVRPSAGNCQTTKIPVWLPMPHLQ